MPMSQRITGVYQDIIAGGEEVAAFVPHPLPPEAPPLQLGKKAQAALYAAEYNLARLDLSAGFVPSVDWLLYAFVRKEAVLSSQIEGTQATLVDLLTFEAGEDSTAEPPNADLEEVCNYLEALEFARAELARDGGLPLSIRLLNETHRRLLRGARGSNKQPGQIRRSQNWLGGSRPSHASHVPPPPHLLGDLLADLERYIHSEDTLPPLVRAGLLHVQFATLHPYLDGNGRIGRLLVTLLLGHWKLMSQPMLYLSLFLKRHRTEYYERLDAVRHKGDWEGWNLFFLEGIASTAREASDTVMALFALVQKDRQRVLDSSGLAAVRLFESLPQHPIVSVTTVVNRLETTKPTAGRAISELEKLGILVEITGKKRDRSWAYRGYLARLRVGTELEGDPRPDPIRIDN